MSKIGERFAATVRAARTRMKMTQMELAEAIDGSIDGVGAIERGVHDASLQTAAAMIQALGIDANQLFAVTNLRTEVGLSRLTHEAELGQLAQRIDDRGLALLIEVAQAVIKVHPAEAERAGERKHE